MKVMEVPMRKIIAILLCIFLPFTKSYICLADDNTNSSGLDTDFDTNELCFNSFSDPTFLQYTEDMVYTSLAGNLNSGNFIIEDVSAIFISQEYIEEVAYNTKSNIYFGFNLAELNIKFEGKRYVFTCSEDGQTVVQEFEAFPDNTNAII